jgi:hypothetical protein
MGLFPNVKDITAQLNDKFDRLIAKLDEILTELRTQKGEPRGSVPLALIIGVVIVLVLLGGLGVCGDALFEDEDERNDLGLPALVLDHEYDDGGYYDRGGDQNYEDQWSNEDRNRNRNRNRGAFSPGPFDDSPVDAFNNVCMPGATCHYDGRQEDPPPNERETR